MKRMLFVFIAAFAMMGCTQIFKPEQAVHVYDSAWHEVDPNNLPKATAGLAEGGTVSLDGVAVYNATHTDDALFVYYGDPVLIGDAPDSPIYVVNSATLAVYFSAIVPRTDLETRREAWRATVEAMADPATGMLVPCTLYVDHVPPSPPVIVPPEPKLYVALIDVTQGGIYYAQKFDTEDAAFHQYKMLQSQADLNNLGLGDGYGNPGDVWQAYWGETEYKFP